MISCTDFIPAYSELFKFLEEIGGEDAVMDFWNHLSDEFLTNLKTLVEENGIRGCWMYWSHTLNEEAADFTMELDEEAGEFKVTMHKCPSKGMLLECNHIEAYRNYCGHCDVLYRRVLKPLGYDCVMNFSDSHKAACELQVSRKSC